MPLCEAKNSDDSGFNQPRYNLAASHSGPVTRSSASLTTSGAKHSRQRPLCALIAEKIGHNQFGAKPYGSFEVHLGQAIIDLGTDVLSDIVRDAAAQLVKPVCPDTFSLRKRCACSFVATGKHERGQNIFTRNILSSGGGTGLVILSVHALEVAG
jgi:hypothetical protein